MSDAFICDDIRTPIGRFGGALASVRADDLAAIPLKTLIERHPRADQNVLGLRSQEKPAVARANGRLAAEIAQVSIPQRKGEPVVDEGDEHPRAVLGELEIPADDRRVNVEGGAIALRHPLGISGAWITGAAALDLSLRKAPYALATMCIGVGQGIAVAQERV